MVKFDGLWWYAYDGAGNRMARAKVVQENPDGTITIDNANEYREYSWDLHIRLVISKQMGIATTGADLSYAYNVRNRQVRRSGKNGTTVYAYGRQGALSWQSCDDDSFGHYDCPIPLGTACA